MEYGIGELQKVEDILGGGYINVNLKISTTKGDYVLRLFRSELEQERLDYAYFIVLKLCNTGMPALLPITNHEGRAYSRFKQYVVQVTPFIQALKFQWLPSQAYHSGQMLNRMHLTLATVKESPKAAGAYQYYQLDPNSIKTLLKESGHTLQEHDWPYIDEFYCLLNTQPIEAAELPMTIIHGDWNPWNQLYKENHEVSCFLDFDTLQRGERVFDIAYALYFFLIQHRSESLGRAFLKGYGCLTPQEINVLPILIAKVGLYFGILVDFGEFQFERNVEQLKWVISEQGRKTIQSFCSVDG
jgi:Ser/Thr protein kinase RdoA (MazF antagonist)